VSITDDRRLIEDYLPIQAISTEASGEPRTKGHISTLHIWRARRPLVACRAAVYGALVPASQFVPANGSEKKAASLGRANAAKFVDRLCKYPGDQRTIAEAQQHILEAHAERLAQETGKRITVEDIQEGRAPRPKVLDMFAGGGAIPLEALRLGCETHALDLNPVAHLIELCTVTYPQQFGEGLAGEVEVWGKRILERTQAEVSDLYACVSLPAGEFQSDIFRSAESSPTINLLVVAYYWTRTIPCPNLSCRGTVPLYRQTWLRKKDSGFIALKPQADLTRKKVRFQVVRGDSEASLGFDPGEGSEQTATVCPFCQAAVDAKYVRNYGDTKGFDQQLMCVIALNPYGSGKLYIADESLAEGEAERQALAEERALILEQELGGSSLDEEIPPTGNAGLATGKSYLYGIKTFRQAFTPRQRCVLLTLTREIRRAHKEMLDEGMGAERAKAITTYLGLWLSRLTDRFNALVRWENSGEKAQGLTSMKRFAMAWDFPEINIFGGASGDAWGNLEYITAVIRQEGRVSNPAWCVRGSATELSYPDQTFDAVITDPPYYDNESYSELSDVCYVWLRPTIGFLYPEHFAGSLTPKKKECVAAAYRQGGKEAAHRFYEDCLFQSLQQAHRVIKPSGILVMVYAHKTTAGWGTLVDAIRRAGFEVAEAWPLDTEAKGRVAHHGDAALASSIFLVARKREGAKTGSYEEEVRPELERIVRERVETLWEMGIVGADLVIAAVGAGLRAFTRFERVEYANGEEVPAEKFLAEVEGVVLETLLEKIFDVPRSGVAAVDGPSRFYVLWRYTYKAAEMDAGEAIVFTYGQAVELDGQRGLSSGSRALVEKKKGKYRLHDFTERGRDEKLGLSDTQTGTPAQLIDVLHRVLWIIENEPRNLTKFLDESRPDRERLRLVAQALAGAGLKGKSEDGAKGLVTTTTSEQAALGKLLANWRTLMESSAIPLFELR
jgi:putative DNA methylase